MMEEIMKTDKIALFLLIYTFLCLSGYTQENSMENLKTRMDSLEARLETVYIEQVDSNPYATGETLDWGKGWNFSALVGGPAYFWDLDIGYNFMIKKTNFLSSKQFIANPKGFRLGLSLGMQSFYQETINKPDDYHTYLATGYGLQGKFLYFSPVLLNFISFATYFKLAYLLPGPNDLDIKDNRISYGLGGNIEFWQTSKMCVFTGFLVQSDFKEVPLYPLKFRVNFGARVYF
jgi:hypothetical protein